MKKYEKQVTCDSRGQLVIPKEVRKELFIDEGTGFWVFLIQEEGILLKRIDDGCLDPKDSAVNEIIEKSEKIGMSRKNVDRSVNDYSGKDKGGFREI